MKQLFVYKPKQRYSGGIVIAPKSQYYHTSEDWEFVGTLTEWIKQVRKEGGGYYAYCE